MRENITINDKMNIVFNDALKENEILTLNEKKVLASLLYSWKCCSEAKKNGELIRAIRKIRTDTAIGLNCIYDALYNLEFLYGMIQRKAGTRRTASCKAEASKFKLNFEKIFNPPVELVKFDFSEELKSSETSISYVDIDKDKDVDKDEVEELAKAVEVDEVKAIEKEKEKAKEVEVELAEAAKLYTEEPLTTEDLDINSIFIENKRKPKKGNTIKELEERMSWEQAFGNILQHQAKHVLSTVKPIE